MKTIKPFRLTTLHRPYAWRGKNFLSVCVIALADMKDPAKPSLLSDVELWREVLPELDCDGVIDHVLPKVVPEYLIGGYAYTAHQQDKRRVMVRADIAGLGKALLVFGDRYWIGDQPTEPEPFDRMPLSWARAYGGKDYPDNPGGRGIEPGPDPLGRLPLPNVESPVDRYQYGRRGNRPYGFGPVNMLYPRRFRHLGTYSEQWKRQEFPGFFPDMNPLMFNAAEPDQRWDRLTQLPLGAAFSIWNMHPERPCWQGTLPRWHARAFIRPAAGDDCREVEMRATTAWFVPHQERVVLIFHGNIEVQEDDASDVACLMSALEADGGARDIGHYRQMMQVREDPEQGAPHVLCDDELITASILGPINLDLEAVYQTPTWIKSQNYKNKLIAEQRQFIADAGQNPDDYLPEEYGPHRKYGANDLALLAQETARLEDEAKEIKLRMEQDRDRLKAEYAAQGTPMPHDGPASVAGPPKELYALLDDPGRVRGVVDINTGQVDFGRIPGVADDQELAGTAGKTQAPPNYAEFIARHPEMKKSIDWPDDAAFRRKMQSMRPMVHQGYLLAAHTQGTPGRLSPEQNQPVRARVAWSCRTRASLDGLDLTGADLSGMTFQGIDCRRALLEHSSLAGCRFIDCDMTEAVLTRADLAGAVFSGCNLEGASLSALTAQGATFEHCRFKHNVLEDAVFVMCRFQQVTIDSWMPSKLRFEQCLFSESELSMSILDETGMVACRLDDVTLTKVSFQKSEFDKTVFGQCRLDGCAFFISRLANVFFHESHISNSAFMHQTQLEACSFEASQLRQCNFRETPMTSACFENARMDVCDFSLADMRHANLRNCCTNNSMYIRTVLNFADFRNANCIGSDFKAADLRHANLAQANLFRASFSLSRLDGTTLMDGAYTKEANTYPQRKGA